MYKYFVSLPKKVQCLIFLDLKNFLTFQNIVNDVLIFGETCTMVADRYTGLL